MKPLLPTLKTRHRYVLYETITAHPIESDISDSLLQAIHEVLGVFGYARSGVLSVSFDEKTQTGILRCDNAALIETRAALLMITHLGKIPVIMKVRGVSGTLDGAKRFLPSTARKTTKETTKGLRVKKRVAQTGVPEHN